MESLGGSWGAMGWELEVANCDLKFAYALRKGSSTDFTDYHRLLIPHIAL
jgi:hypothetical protein